jgi:hypothetical protein
MKEAEISGWGTGKDFFSEKYGKSSHYVFN